MLLTILLLLSIFSISTSSFAAPEKNSHEKISAELAGKIDESPDSVIPVIIQTQQGLQQKHKTWVQQRGGQIRHNLSIIKGFSADLPAAAIEKMAQDNDVIKITYDAEVQTCLDTAVPAINAPAAWEAGLTGQGVTVAVIDTGIYPHPDLVEPNNRIIGFKDFVKKKTSPYDDCGHGTHVAGIIAGNGTESGGQYKGVAPEADLVGVKVLNAKGSGPISNVIAGVQWVVQNKAVYNIKVVNLSLGAVAKESYTTDPMSQAVEAAWDAGLVVVAAAGNSGPEPGTIGTPGINPRIITVGAADDLGTIDMGDDVIAEFSSRGPTIDGLSKPDLAAPGVGITSLAADTSYLPKKNINSGGKPKAASMAKTPVKPAQAAISEYYITASGTSMATPVVSGTAALLLEQNPDWMPDEVKEQVVSNAVDLGFEADAQGAGEILF
nr:S8 family peptidase [Phosphitispora fastidiosa]